MFKVRTLNQISVNGLERFSRDHYEVGTEIADPDAVLLRSYKLSPEELTPAVRAIGRAGAGVNNIPVDHCTEKGIVVFNTPGANANAVKELVMAGLLLSARGIVDGIQYVRDLAEIGDHDELNKAVEAGKKQFKGNEIAGKTLGVLGLGAIGSMVAEMALQAGMEVLGYDPSLSIEAAWRLSNRVQNMENMQALFSRADILTLHVPALPTTRGMIDEQALSYFKDGSVLLNFARGELIVEADVAAALASGKLSKYISDFPSTTLIGEKGVLATPHLGASTKEAEDNCAVMVADQIIDFLTNGNISNSVNFPNLNLERSTGYRLALANRNVPRILGSVLSILAEKNINVIDMLNKSRDEVAYNLIDIETCPDADVVKEILAIDGVINVRTFD